MAIESISEILIGSMVRFRTISPHDNVVWVGRLDARCTYDIARTIYDVDPMYMDVKRVNTSMEAKESLTYLVFTIAENGQVPTKRVFAEVWLDPATVELVEENSYVDFRVYDIDASKTDDLRKAIVAMGYTVSVLSTD